MAVLIEAKLLAVFLDLIFLATLKWRPDTVLPLEKMSPNQNEALNVDAYILDWATILNTGMLKPGACTTFNDYVKGVFIPYICHLFRHLDRIDVVWDVYLKDSVNVTTINKSVKGGPGNCESFLLKDRRL